MATNDTTVLQQLMTANLAPMTTVSMLTATKKKLVKAAAWKGTPMETPSGGGAHEAKHPFAGNYCWTHGHRISKEHTSATRTHKSASHRDNATLSNTLGGSEKDKGWDVPHT